MRNAYITQLFIRSLGIVHLFNFLSLLFQVKRLFGSTGLIPVSEYIIRVNEVYSYSFFEKIRACPSIFLLIQNDWLLIAGAILGVLLSLSIISGYYTRWCFLASFLLYMSYVSVGQELYSFQWDSLFLETTFLALLLPSARFGFKNFSTGTDKLTLWLFYWLLFRLYIESGVAKLFWGPDSWATLEALSHYYETAPLPTLFGYYLHFMPEWWHQLETGLTLIIEILLPGLIFSSKKIRRILFVIFTFFQLGIIATGNYGIFNYVTLCLHLFLLSDKDLKFLLKKLALKRNFKPTTSSRISWKKYAMAVIVISFSLIEFMMLAGGSKISQTTIGTIQKYTGATKISSRYHLFGPIDPTRYELIIEAQLPNNQWMELDFPFKIDGINDKFPFVAPNHPRVDFRLWFERYPVGWSNTQDSYPDVEAAPSILGGYLGKLVEQLINEPKLGLRHVRSNPDLTSDTLNIRVSYYHYKMEPPGSDNYWSRKKVGTVYFNPALEKELQKIIIRQVN